MLDWVDFSQGVESWSVLIAVPLFVIWRLHAITAAEDVAAAKGGKFRPRGLDAAVAAGLKMIKADAAAGVVILLFAIGVASLGPWVMKVCKEDLLALEGGVGAPRRVNRLLALLHELFGVRGAMGIMWTLWAAGTLGGMRAAWEAFRGSRGSQRTLYDVGRDLLTEGKK